MTGGSLRGIGMILDRVAGSHLREITGGAEFSAVDQPSPRRNVVTVRSVRQPLKPARIPVARHPAKCAETSRGDLASVPEAGCSPVRPLGAGPRAPGGDEVALDKKSGLLIASSPISSGRPTSNDPFDVLRTFPGQEADPTPGRIESRGRGAAARIRPMLS